MPDGNNDLPSLDSDLDLQPTIVGLTNKDLIIEALERTEIDNGGILAEYLDDPLEDSLLSSDYRTMLSFIRVVKMHEANNQNYLPRLLALEADISRCIDLVDSGQPAELSAQNFETYSSIYVGLRDYRLTLNDSRDQVSTLAEDVPNAVSGLITTLNENAAGLSENQTAALYGAAFLAILWTYTSKSDTAKALRSAVHYAGIGLLGAYVANAGTRLLTGDDILGNLERLNRRNNDEITSYFGLDPELPSDNLVISALLDSTLEEPKLANDTSFATMIAAYNPNSRTLPDFIYAGTSSFDSPDKREALCSAVGLIYSKFGPGSDLNYSGSDMEARWNFAMSNPDVSWQQGVFSLMSLDQNAPDLYPTYTESVMDFIGYRAELIASPAVTWSMEVFESVARSMPGGAVGFMDALRRMFPGGDPENGMLKNYLDIEINSPEQLTNVAGNYGRFAYAALNSNNQNHIFEDSAGNSYTTVNLPINSVDAADQALQHLRIVDAYVTAFGRFSREYPEDRDLASNINVLFGARNPSNGTYTISFSYAIEGTPARENDILRPIGLDYGQGFTYQSFTPSEKAYLLSFYQCDEDTFITEYLPDLVSGMPDSADTVREKFDYMLNRDLREQIITDNGRTFNPDLVTLYNDLERKNIEFADTLPNEEQITLFYNSVAVMHSIFANPHTRQIVGLTSSSTNTEIVSAYEEYLETYIAEFNSTNFGRLTLLDESEDLNSTYTSEYIRENPDFDYEIATQRYFSSLCDRNRTSVPDPIPYLSWSFEYASDEPAGSFSPSSFEMEPNSVIFLGQGTEIACNNSIVANWYREKVYRDLNGQIVDFNSVFSYNESTNTFIANQDLTLNYNESNPRLEKGVRISGNIYYYMQNY